MRLSGDTAISSCGAAVAVPGAIDSSRSNANGSATSSSTQVAGWTAAGRTGSGDRGSSCDGDSGRRPTVPWVLGIPNENEKWRSGCRTVRQGVCRTCGTDRGGWNAIYDSRGCVTSSHGGMHARAAQSQVSVATIACLYREQQAARTAKPLRGIAFGGKFARQRLKKVRVLSFPSAGQVSE